MLGAALPRALCRLSARRYPAGLRPPRAAWRGEARGEESSGRTGFERWRWARPVGGALTFLGAFSLFPRDAEEDGEDAIILLLKRAKLSVMKGELGEAEKLLHEALRLSHQSENRKAIIYTYSMMANVAFMQGQLDNAEKLYKASMSYLLSGDTKEDDNAILEMSLKLASIYAAQKQHKLALAGYEFCILTLEEKIAKQKDLPEDVLPAEEKANTRLLLGMSLDSYARYLLNINQLPAAQKMYEKALQISKDVQGETHAQTVVLMSDLATVLDAQGHHDEAYSYVKRAAELAKETQHPEEHMVLNNLAAILMHKVF
ncbi:tetratricopeptide repeat protein 19, mitochondrial isoform X2 [Neopsephotus bourkii]|uniref:tetratricopeptide repeat protein 19, mitochondrial isoform X2 n=1 Tax=Neopsephotus bourkii TaxID=309878 RepID=UPI002AA562F5|nr:tetratricopeptide repeat protein 19, mitochondrial isoform X2 [Neopsephotus bourkii]